MAERCLHGMDPRFCANCNRRSSTGVPATLSSSGGSATIADILSFLNAERVRASYAAVGELVGVPARSVDTLLGDRRPEASWVVDATNRLPSGYDADQCHPDLLANAEVIGSGRELLLRLALWRKTTPH